VVPLDALCEDTFAGLDADPVVLDDPAPSHRVNMISYRLGVKLLDTLAVKTFEYYSPWQQGSAGSTGKPSDLIDSLTGSTNRNKHKFSNPNQAASASKRNKDNPEERESKSRFVGS
jgi:hypothetical protein